MPFALSKRSSCFKHKDLAPPATDGPPEAGLEVSEGMSRLPSVSGLSRNPHHNMVLGTIIEH